MADLDQRVRLAAFDFLDRLRTAHGDTLPRGVLVAGFDFEGRRVPLLAPQGIFKPAILRLPLSMATVPPSARKPRPYIVGDDRRTATFTVAVDDRQLALAPADLPETEIRRRHVTRLVRQRLHQQAFRERVLDAYRQHCAICRLRHQELLEAAPIVADRDP